jgi:hypothetical protein
VSLDRFELLELRREGIVKTYHAREIATARPVQVHLFTGPNASETAQLLELVPHLSDAERRRVLDRGESQGLPYIVTDRLAGYVDFREWITVNSRPAAERAPAPTPSRSIDEEFFSLFDSAPPVAAVAQPAPAPQSPDRQVEQREEPSLMGASLEIEAVRPRRGFLPTAAKSLLWLVLGVLTALALLAGIAAFFAFRPH